MSSAASTPIAGPDTGFSRPAWLAEQLQQRIVSGAYPPGERMRENELQKEFGFSNGPVREALQTVVAAGLAERTPWQGVRVIDLDEREILELFQLRAALLQYAVELAARYGSDAVLAQSEALKENLREVFKTAAETGTKLTFSGRLSSWLLEACGNETIRHLYHNTLLRAQIYVNNSMRQSAGLETLSIICELIDAVAARDVAKALEDARRLQRQTLVNLGIEGPI